VVPSGWRRVDPLELLGLAQYVDPSLRWRTLDTEHFSVHFGEHLRSQAQVVGSVAESIHRASPPAALEARGAHPCRGSRFARSFQRPRLAASVQLCADRAHAPDEGELLQNREWLELVLIHEFTHIAHMDRPGMTRSGCAASSQDDLSVPESARAGLGARRSRCLLGVRSGQGLRAPGQSISKG